MATTDDIQASTDDTTKSTDEKLSECEGVRVTLEKEIADKQAEEAADMKRRTELNRKACRDPNASARTCRTCMHENFIFPDDAGKRLDVLEPCITNGIVTDDRPLSSNDNVNMSRGEKVLAKNRADRKVDQAKKKAERLETAKQAGGGQVMRATYLRRQGGGSRRKKRKTKRKGRKKRKSKKGKTRRKSRKSKKGTKKRKNK